MIFLFGKEVFKGVEGKGVCSCESCCFLNEDNCHALLHKLDCGNLIWEKVKDDDGKIFSMLEKI